MSTASAKNEAKACVAMLAELGNKIVSFRGGAGLVATTGFIDRADDLFGDETAMNDARYMATLLVEEVADVHRGDIVTDEDGTEWTLLTELPQGSDFTVDWTCERKA